MICVFCNEHVDSRRDADDLAWIHTFWWRLRIYEGPVCQPCAYEHLVLATVNGQMVLVLCDNDPLPPLALLLTSERSNKQRNHL